MSLLDWLNMNLAVDIACVVYLCALTWKNIKIQKSVEETNNNLNKLHVENIKLRDKLELVIKNPQAARRKLNLLKE